MVEPFGSVTQLTSGSQRRKKMKAACGCLLLTYRGSCGKHLSHCVTSRREPRPKRWNSKHLSGGSGVLIRVPATRQQYNAGGQMIFASQISIDPARRSHATFTEGSRFIHWSYRHIRCLSTQKRHQSSDPSLAPPPDLPHQTVHNLLSTVTPRYLFFHRYDSYFISQYK
jgi:hypothetical protein